MSELDLTNVKPGMGVDELKRLHSTTAPTLADQLEARRSAENGCIYFLDVEESDMVIAALRVVEELRRQRIERVSTSPGVMILGPDGEFRVTVYVPCPEKAVRP